MNLITFILIYLAIGLVFAFFVEISDAYQNSGFKTYNFDSSTFFVAIISWPIALSFCVIFIIIQGIEALFQIVNLFKINEKFQKIMTKFIIETAKLLKNKKTYDV